MSRAYDIPLCEPLPAVKGRSGSEPFEQRWSAYVGTAHGVAFQDTRTAYHALFRALGLEPGDRALVSACCTAPLWDAITAYGLDPVVRDPDPHTLVLTGSVDAAIWAGIDVAFVTHLYGRPAHLESIVGFALKFGVPVIEDALHAQGAEYRGKKVGCFGDAAVFCFRDMRILGDDEGGAVVVTSRDDIAEALRGGRRFSTEANARLGTRLDRLEKTLGAREAIASAYRERLGSMEGMRVVLPERQGRHVYYRYVIRVAEPDIIAARLQEHGIETGRVYFRALETDAKLPVARTAAREIVYLPMAPSRGEEAVAEVCRRLEEILPELGGYIET